MAGVLIDLIANKISCNSNKYTKGKVSVLSIEFVTTVMIIQYVLGSTALDTFNI